MKALLILALFIPTLVTAQNVTWSWGPVTEATNGDKISPTGYNLYCSFGEFTTIDNKYTSDLAPGLHTCQIATILGSVESDRTIDYPFTVPELVPNSPTNITVTIEINIKIESN